MRTGVHAPVHADIARKGAEVEEGGRRVQRELGAGNKVFWQATVIGRIPPIWKDQILVVQIMQVRGSLQMVQIWQTKWQTGGVLDKRSRATLPPHSIWSHDLDLKRSWLALILRFECGADFPPADQLGTPYLKSRQHAVQFRIKSMRAKLKDRFSDVFFVLVKVLKFQEAA